MKPSQSGKTNGIVEKTWRETSVYGHRPGLNPVGNRKGLGPWESLQMHCLVNVGQECGGVLHRSCCVLYTGYAARFTPAMLRALHRSCCAQSQHPGNRLGIIQDRVLWIPRLTRAMTASDYPARSVMRWCWPGPASTGSATDRQAQLPRASTGTATRRPVAELAEAKHQGLSSWTRRKPKLLERAVGLALKREAERTVPVLFSQEPPRIVRKKSKKGQTVRVLPSLGWLL